MATPLDLQEQEQLDALKSFWKQHGTFITVLLLALATAYAGWNGWNWVQRDRAQKAGAMYGALEAAVQSGDAERGARIFADIRDRYPKTVFAQQAGLAAAKVQFDKGQLDAAQASLAWVADHALEAEYRTMARLRLAALQAGAKKFDEALKTLDGATAAGFEGLVADRRGDVLTAAGKPAEALVAYQAAWKTLDPKADYRRLLEAKLTALGAAPQPAADVGAGAGAASAAVGAGAASVAAGASR